MGTERFFGMPPDEVERVRAEGQELVPIGRDVPWHVTEEIIEACVPDPERRLHVYRSLLEGLRRDNAISKRFFAITPEGSDPTMKVVDLDAYRQSKASPQEPLD